MRAANRHANVRQALGRQLASAVDNAQVAHAGRVALEQALDAPAWVRVAHDTSTGGSAAPGDTDLAAADWALRHGQPSGRFTDTLAGADWWFLPLLDGEGHGIGVAGLRFDRQHPRLAPEQRQLAEAMVDDIAQAALRTRLVADLETAHLHNETERLRSALLSSVSHDLRSPLAAMIGSADSLSSYAEAMDAGDRRALLDTIVVEGERLSDRLRAGPMPLETRNYVEAITGSTVEAWAAAGRNDIRPPRAPPASCRELMALLEQAPNPFVAGLERRIALGAAKPWGVQLAGGFSRGKALAMYARAMKRFGAVIGDRDPSLLRSLNRSRGTRAFYQVRIGAESRRAADDLCNRVRRAGGACFVLRNRGMRG